MTIQVKIPIFDRLLLSSPTIAGALCGVAARQLGLKPRKTVGKYKLLPSRDVNNNWNGWWDVYKDEEYIRSISDLPSIPNINPLKP